MGNKFAKPAWVVDKRGKRRKPSTLGGEHNVPVVKVLEGAHGVQVNAPITVAGRDVNNVYNVYYNSSESAANKDADDALLLKILEYLGELNFRKIFNENLAKRTPETGRGVIESDWFREWLMDLLGGIVWGTGMPGAGKTVLACIVIEYLQKFVEKSKSQDICLLFAFCRYTEPLMVIDILLAILRQLLERHPQVLPYVKPIYERHKRENTRPSEAEVVDLLRQIASSGLFRRTFYILDGLDEAASDIQVDLLEILSSLPVNFFITSRPLDSIKDLVPNARFITIIASDLDIALLIDQKIHRMPVLRKLLMDSATLKAKVVSMITSKSSGMFLLTSLHLDMLKGCTNESQVRKALEGLPRGMDGMYDVTMDRIKALPEHEADLAKRVLFWVAYAQRPLTVEELVLAVSVCPETFRFDDELQPAGIDSILSLCCGLLVQVEATINSSSGQKKLVRLVHYSAAEYLAKTLKLHYPDDPHALITSTCTAFLRYYGFHNMSSQGSGDGDGPWDPLHEKRIAMASYPYEYWGLHARKCRLIPASAWAFLDDCKQYPWFYSDSNPAFWHHKLPSHPNHHAGLNRIEVLQSTHVAAAYGIREYFNRFESKQWNTQARVETNVLNRMGSAGSTPLILASMTGSEDVVAFLMGVKGLHVSSTDLLGHTALFAAVANRHASVVRTILSRSGLDVNQRTKQWDGDTALTLASRTGQHDIVQLLLGAETVDVNVKNWDDKSALGLALWQDHQDVVRMLLQAKGTHVLGAFRNASTKGFDGLDGERASNSLSEAVMTVLKHGTASFDVNAKDHMGRSALAYSLRNPFFAEVAEALLRIPGSDINSADVYGTTILMLALEHATNAPKLVKTIIKLGSTLDINAKDANGRTALAHAVSRGSREIVTMLLEVKGVDCNCVDTRGWTPLMIAVESGRDAVVALLLELQGVDYNCVDAKGQTALMIAVERGYDDTAALLLGLEGIDCNCVDSKGKTALMLAAGRGYDDVVALLLEHEGIKANFKDVEGNTALEHAISWNRVEAAEALLKVDSTSADYATPEGLTYLMLAAQSNTPEIIRLMLQLPQFRAIVNAQDIRGRTALAHAVEWLHDAVESLLEVEGVDVQCVDEQGMTLLMYASRVETVEIVNMFLERGLGANINATDIEGKTALFHAAESYWDNPDIVSALLNVEDIDCSIQDVAGRTPLMVAIEKGHDRAEELLQGVIDD